MKELKGIRGWLLFFIIAGIIRTFVNLLLAIGISTGDDYAGFRTAAITFVFFVLCYETARLYSLWRLVAVRPGAVPFIKKILLIDPLFTAVAPLVMLALIQFVSEVPVFTADIINESYDFDVNKDIVGASLYAAIWYAYFCRSRRVKNTFGV